MYNSPISGYISFQINVFIITIESLASDKHHMQSSGVKELLCT